jgi:hypothetical protein
MELNEELTAVELRVISELTLSLVELKQQACGHLAIENVAPALFHELMSRLILLKNGSILVPDGTVFVDLNA